MDTKKIFQYSLLILLFVVSFLFYYKYFFKDDKKVELNKSENIVKKKNPEVNQNDGNKNMKVVSSLKTLKSRDRNCQVVRRRGRLYVINKKNPRFKARQG